MPQIMLKRKRPTGMVGGGLCEEAQVMAYELRA